MKIALEICFATSYLSLIKHISNAIFIAYFALASVMHTAELNWVKMLPKILVNLLIFWMPPDVSAFREALYNKLLHRPPPPQIKFVDVWKLLLRNPPLPPPQENLRKYV